MIICDVYYTTEGSHEVDITLYCGECVKEIKENFETENEGATIVYISEAVDQDLIEDFNKYVYDVDNGYRED